MLTSALWYLAGATRSAAEVAMGGSRSQLGEGCFSVRDNLFLDLWLQKGKARRRLRGRSHAGSTKKQRDLCPGHPGAVTN